MGNLIKQINNACAKVREIQDDADLYNTPEWQTWRELVLNGSLVQAIRMVRGQQMVQAKYVYALTINAGPVSGPTLTQIVGDVFKLKAFKKADVRYSFECYDEERNLTHRHMHAIVYSDKYISVKDVRKTSKCMTDMKRLSGVGIKKWLNYIEKDNRHEPTREHLLQHEIITEDEVHYGHYPVVIH